ncbi:MAG: putative ATP synthase subunit E [Candidatus Paraimprobicoccus trichonymphae]|uniref:ATP synthase subunit E n=1 Tax=Candidatus Paraimprobicoccus trichonymphae TaxID=3033793 RepID=A0AA48IHC3_9FIRM|nr:MAG: putative ATP synthase subunit E [Candidatus Paraimprobicoccus trichonymphae]
MPDNNEKASRFLQAMSKYAKKQQNKVYEEIKELEQDEINNVETKITRDINNMIQTELSKMKNSIEVVISNKESELKKDLSNKRQEMLEEIFDECKLKLVRYSQKSEYLKDLKKSAFDIFNVFRDFDDIELYLKEIDLKYADIIKGIFNNNCKIFSDEYIEIGGISGYSGKLGLFIDETLDSKLKEQRKWFIGKYGFELF